MKRILSFILLLIICAMTFTACQMPEQLQSVIDKIMGKEPAVEVTYDLDGAVKYLVDVQYASWSKDNTTATNVLLVPQVIVKRVSYKVTWTCDSDILTITPNADGSSTVVIPKLAEAHEYSLTATITDGNGKTATHKFDLVVPANLSGEIVKPEVGTGYYLQIEQNKAKKVLFFNGKPESESKTYRLAMTTNPATAVQVFVEAVEGVEGGYRLYFMNGEVKTYLVVSEYEDKDAPAGSGKGTITWETETPEEYYTYDATAKTFIHTDADGEDSYYMGTYSTYETISVSNTSYISGDSAKNVDVSQFPVRFVSPDSVPSHTCKYVDEVTAPTCTADGFTTHTCSICGDSSKDTFVDKLGHTDANKDHVCDIESCGAENVGKCEDGDDEDILCDYGCGKEYTPDTPVKVEDIKLTVDSLGLPSQSYSAGTATVGGVEFGYTELGSYGDGIQMRIKNGNTASLWNTQAFSAGIAKIIVEYNSAKNTYDTTDAMIFTFGDSADALAHEVKMSAVKDQFVFEITPDANTYKFFKLTYNNSKGSSYITSITIVFADGTTVTPEQPEGGEGTVTPPATGEKTTVNLSIADYASANSWADSTLYASITMNGGITVTSSGTPVGDYDLNTGKFYTSNSTWRIYQTENPSVTITAAEGKTIVSVKITYSVKNSGTLTHNGTNISSGTLVTVNANSVTFNVGNTGTKTNGQAQITSIEVIYQ